jgi:hypothetical protein
MSVPFRLYAAGSGIVSPELDPNDKGQHVNP